jgi:hypothetical protein
MLQIFRMDEYNLTKVPMVEGTRLTLDTSNQKVDATTYRKMVGKLIFTW